MMKLLWVKFGWSEFYRGGPVDGNFGWLNKRRGGEEEGRGHEAFNFMPAADGSYRCYVPPQAGRYAPSHIDNEGWTVVCLAKNPKHSGIYIVGWYEDATLLGKWLKADTRNQASAYENSYCITSPSAYFVPPQLRHSPFSDKSVTQGKYSFLSGPDIDETDNKRHVRAIIETRLRVLKGFAVHNPSAVTAPDPEVYPGDPLIGFGTPETRKLVELAAERAVVAHYQGLGFTGTRVAELNCGYDYLFRKRGTELKVEVKGTSTGIEQFYLTRNEYKVHLDPSWRLAIVINALTRPQVSTYNAKTFKTAFDLEPYVYLGKKIDDPETK